MSLFHGEVLMCTPGWLTYCLSHLSLTDGQLKGLGLVCCGTDLYFNLPSL